MRIMNKKIHFSVDDTFGCFFWLHKNRKSVKGIFDSSTFDFAKKIYENYGVSTSFYCMYSNEKKFLSDFILEWQEQFQDCKEWMKFGFHCYNEKSNYTTASMERIEGDYLKVIDALFKITGGGMCFTDTLRLHNFSGNTSTVKFLRKNAINRLLCADDNRGSYNLSKNAEMELKQKGFYYDENTGMEYVPTDFRIENMKNINAEIIKIKESHQDVIVVFTHERYLKNPEIRDKIEQFLKIYMKMER